MSERGRADRSAGLRFLRDPAAALFLLLLVVWGSDRALAEVPGAVTCPPGAHSPQMDAARAALGQDEQALEPRLKLADALLARGCYADAVHVLEDGEAFHARNAAIQGRLRDARSMLNEQHYFDGLGRAEEAAKMQRNLLRCQKLNDPQACDAALQSNPNDVQLLVAKADALLRTNHPADALPIYRRAAELNPADTGLRDKVAAAETQRQALVTQCENGQADAALQACQLAVLRGASDEFSLQQRKAILLQSMDKPGQALDAYIAASLLKPDDKAVARGIVGLTESTGRNDALTLAARGSALLTLGRGTDAVRVLKQAQQLSPGIPDMKVRLAAAEKLAREEGRADARKKAADQADAKTKAVLAAELGLKSPGADAPSDAAITGQGAGSGIDRERTSRAGPPLGAAASIAAASARSAALGEAPPGRTYSNTGAASRSH